MGAAPGAGVTALALVLAVTLGACAESVRGIDRSMEPTVTSGEILDLDSGAYDDRPPEVGDVIALRAPAGLEGERCGAPRPPRSPCPMPVPGTGEDSLIKRVVALPGDRIAIDRRGRAVLNGRALYQPFIIGCGRDDLCELPDPIQVPPDHYFVLGDNRPVSSDSRQWGPVPLSAIEGRITPLRNSG